eukprot:scaffold78465_cov36-Phaeocystis_antarctica.AAC.1
MVSAAMVSAARYLEVARLDLGEEREVLGRHLLAPRPPLRREEVAPEGELLVLCGYHLGVLHQ